MLMSKAHTSPTLTGSTLTARAGRLTAPGAPASGIVIMIRLVSLSLVESGEVADATQVARSGRPG